jgi:hypothetical protein
VLGQTASVFSFDAPALTAVSPYNFQGSGGALLSMFGVNFANYNNASPSASVGTTGCATTSWQSVTSLSCASPNNAFAGALLTLTVAAAGSTRLGLFTFNAPVVTLGLLFNSPQSGGSYVTIGGTNFWSQDTTPSFQLGTTVCGTSAWSTLTSVTCQGQSGDSAANSVALTVSRSIGTLVSVFSFDAPVLTLVLNANGPSTGGFSVTLNGMNFGVYSNSPTVYMEKTPCLTASWVSVRYFCLFVSTIVAAFACSFLLVIVVSFVCHF